MEEQGRRGDSVRDDRKRGGDVDRRIRIGLTFLGIDCTIEARAHDISTLARRLRNSEGSATCIDRRLIEPEGMRAVGARRLLPRLEHVDAQAIEEWRDAPRWQRRVGVDVEHDLTDRW